MIVVLSLLGTILLCGIAWYGIKLCQENKAVGLIPLFISLNLLGLLIGGVILYDIKNKRSNSPVKEIKNVEIIKEEE